MKLSKSVIRAVLRGARPAFGSRRMGRSAGGASCSNCSRLRLVLQGHPLRARHHRGCPRRAGATPASATHGTLIYLHGGAYALGSAKGYRGLVAQLAAAAGMTALVPDYSRAPEARYPIALEEMVAVYSPVARRWA